RPRSKARPYLLNEHKNKNENILINRQFINAFNSPSIYEIIYILINYIIIYIIYNILILINYIYYIYEILRLSSLIRQDTHNFLKKLAKSEHNHRIVKAIDYLIES